MLIHPQKSLGDDGFNHMHFVHVKPLDELNHEIIDYISKFSHYLFRVFSHHLISGACMP